jgi:CubicO group peptidase (beta-lactamase class C family)
MRFAQMLLNQGELDGARILGRKTVALMCANHLPPSLLPMDSGDGPMLGRGHGLGLWILTDPVAAGGPETAGTCEHEGAASTYFWVDPAEELIGLFMTQYMGMEIPHAYFRVLTYQAISD